MTDNIIPGHIRLWGFKEISRTLTYLYKYNIKEAYYLTIFPMKFNMSN